MTQHDSAFVLVAEGTFKRRLEERFQRILRTEKRL